MPATGMRPVRVRLDVLTSIRFFAALHVVFCHLFRANLAHWADVATERAHLHGSVAAAAAAALLTGAANVAANGGASVTLFFVLSGLILAYSYMDAAGELTTSRRAFWIARFARIYPTYLLGVVLIAKFEIARRLGAAPMHGGQQLTVTGLLNLLLLQSWVPADAMTWNFPGWSLSVEAFFYLTFPFLAVRLFRNRGRRSLHVVVAASVALVALIGWAHWQVVQGVGGWQMDDRLANPLAVTLPLARLPEFVLGMALGRLFVLRCPNALEESCRLPGVAVAGLAMVPVLIVLALSLPNAGVWSAWHCGVEVVLFSTLIYGLTLTAVSRQGLLLPLLESPPLIFLGEASYALYIIHVPISRWMDLIPHRLWTTLAGHLHHLDAGVLNFGVYLAVVITLSGLTFRYLETPARRWLRDRLEALLLPSPASPIAVLGPGPAPKPARAA